MILIRCESWWCRLCLNTFFLPKPWVECWESEVMKHRQCFSFWNPQKCDTPVTVIVSGGNILILYTHVTIDIHIVSKHWHMSQIYICMCMSICIYVCLFRYMIYTYAIHIYIYMISFLCCVRILPNRSKKTACWQARASKKIQKKQKWMEVPRKRHTTYWKFFPVVPLKISRAPKGKYIIFQPSFFRGELLNFQGVVWIDGGV